MFAIIVVLAGVALVLHEDPWLEVGLLVACLWAGCRFYYFLFHVLERYVGVGGRYRGLLDLAGQLRRQRRGQA